MRRCCRQGGFGAVVSTSKKVARAGWCQHRPTNSALPVRVGCGVNRKVPESHPAFNGPMRSLCSVSTSTACGVALGRVRSVPVFLVAFFAIASLRLR